MIQINLMTSLNVLNMTLRSRQTNTSQLTIRINRFINLLRLHNMLNQIGQNRHRTRIRRRQNFETIRNRPSTRIISFFSTLRRILRIRTFGMQGTSDQLLIPEVIKIRLALRTPSRIINIRHTHQFRMINHIRHCT